MRYLVFLLTLFIFACQSDPSEDKNEKIEEGEIVDNTYKNDDIGWTIKIPEGFKLIPAEEIRRQNEIGREALASGTGENLEEIDIIPLVAFRKDIFNMLISSLEPIKSDTFNFQKNQKKMIGMAYETMTKLGIMVDSTSYEEEIDGLNFKVTRFEAYQESGNLMLTQLLYARRIKDFVIGININFNKEENREIMLETLKKSTFSVRD